LSLLVTGSIGLDTVTTPAGSVRNVLGGSAVFFAFVATRYVPVRLVGVIGDDFPSEYMELLRSKQIDLAGLEVRNHSQTFRWTGRYEDDMNEAQTVKVDLNVLEEQAPKVPRAFADSRAVFLANTHPALQSALLDQLDRPELVVCDTMNLWITTERNALLKTMSRVTGVIFNDAEARLLTERANLIEAGETVLGYGPKFVMIKKAEHGAILVTREGITAIPGYPQLKVRDPTGAGDSFAGGVMGYLHAAGAHDYQTLRRAMVRGTVAASFVIEDFSINAVRDLTRSRMEQRVSEYLDMLRLE